MKKRRFYDDKKRNQKWTEPEVGRKIDFADKYIEGGTSDKFDYKRPKQSGYSADSKNKSETRLRRLVVFVCCAVLVAAGYIIMDVYITRHAEPAKHIGESVTEAGELSDMQINFEASLTDGISLDASVMLSAVINQAETDGLTAVAFEAKRADGTVGYTSTLASVDTFSAMNSAAAKPAQSIKAMLSNDILPVAVVHCYKDNVVPLQASDAAVKTGKKLYKDGDGNYYLNPNSDFTYNYIKDIISELQAYGVTVFVLDSCDLPEDISKKYGDGYETLAKKLYRDIDANIKILEAVRVKIPAKTAANDVKKLKPLNNSQAYIIESSYNTKKLVAALREQSVTAYICD
ncbi:MAG: hypothetical protein E7571_02370 [Ruminococcaceae bacterium]|nr:hypothetical protein [Oscillospiraceae bacterium]